MNQISEQEFREAIIATKKDAKLVAAAKNDRWNSAEALYREFIKLPLDRQREIIASICNDYFVAAQWKIAFQLNNLPAANVPDAVAAVGKALFFTREEESVKETIRVIRQYLESPFYKVIVMSLADSVEIVRADLALVARILIDPELYGMIQTLDPAAPTSEKLIQTVVRIATYTRNQDSTIAVARFLYARRHSSSFADVATLIENTVFMARDPKSVREILAGLGAGAIDRVLQRHNGNKTVTAGIRDLSWKTRDSRVIRDYLEAL
jgi:hypothetical protein